ncbi:MAG: type II toxin-antitoxin system VapC family toxin [Ktedonobacterales bacterium]
MDTSGHIRQSSSARVLVDTNVVLDQLLRREPWYTQAQPFWQARDERRLIAYLPASVLTDIYYIARRQIGSDPARQAVARCLREFGLLAVYRRVLEAAMALPGTDVEDNVQIVCAQFARLDLIVTRDASGFQHSPIPVLNPTNINGWLATRG